MVSSPLSSAELHLAGGKIESRTDRIRGIGTRILREGEDTDFFGAEDGNGFETIRYNSNQL
jgi:hypothetical protein